MNKSQHNRLAMFMAVEGTVKKYDSTFTKVPAFAMQFAKFTQLLDEIQEVHIEQINSLKGYAAQMQQERGELEFFTRQFAGSMISYAAMTGDVMLESAMRKSIRRLHRQRLSTVSICALTVLEHAKQTLALLGDYGLTSAKLSAYEKLIESYDTMLDDRRVALTLRTVATYRMKKLFKETGDLVSNGLDKLMLMFLLEDPTFFNHYFEARKIVKYGIRHKRETEEGTSEEIPGVVPENDERAA